MIVCSVSGFLLVQEENKHERIVRVGKGLTWSLHCKGNITGHFHTVAWLNIATIQSKKKKKTWNNLTFVTGLDHDDWGSKPVLCGPSWVPFFDTYRLFCSSSWVCIPCKNSCWSDIVNYLIGTIELIVLYEKIMYNSFIECLVFKKNAVWKHS